MFHSFIFFLSFISRITEYSLAGWNINENRKKTIDTYTHIHFTIHFIIIFFLEFLYSFSKFFVFCFYWRIISIYILPIQKKTLIYSRHFFFRKYIIYLELHFNNKIKYKFRPLFIGISLFFLHLYLSLSI